MEKSEHQVESPPPPPRKVRRKPLTTKEQGIDVACRHGRFMMPRDALDNKPMAIAIRHHCVQLYNLTADLKALKTECDALLDKTEGAARTSLLTLHRPKQAHPRSDFFGSQI